MARLSLEEGALRRVPFVVEPIEPIAGFRLDDNPVGRGRYTPGKSLAGHQGRGILPRYQKLLWIPNEDQRQLLMQRLELESLPNKAMFLLVYDERFGDSHQLRRM